MVAVWHGYHDRLMSWLDSIEGRVGEIERTKPAYEHETRLRLMKLVKGELPAELATALQAYEPAWQGFEPAWLTYEPAWLAYLAAREAYDTARQAFETLYTKHLPAIEALHAIECPDCPWDGESIFPRRTA